MWTSTSLRALAILLLLAEVASPEVVRIEIRRRAAKGGGLVECGDGPRGPIGASGTLRRNRPRPGPPGFLEPALSVRAARRDHHGPLFPKNRRS